MATSLDLALIEKLPKTDLHVHLDGSIRVKTIIELARKQGVKLPTFDTDGLYRLLYAGDVCNSLDDYLKAFDITLSVMQTEESLGDDEFYAPEDEETVNTIKELLETRVRPAVAQDGGDITFHGYRDGIVYLHMRGACSGCPSSTATLRHGIENLLRHFIPEVQEVRPV